MLTNLPPAMRLTGIGFYFALCIVGGIGGGLGLDELLGTRPVFVLVGLGLGLAAAFWGGYLLIMEVVNQQNPKEDEDA